MRQNKIARMLLVATSQFVFSATFAAVTPTNEPLSGLNLEDFQISVKNEASWDSNPFIKYGDSPQTRQMVLYGIIYRPGKSLALINSEIVKVGDKIGASEVVKIEEQKVILRNSDGIYQISFRGPQNEGTEKT